MPLPHCSWRTTLPAQPPPTLWLLSSHPSYAVTGHHMPIHRLPSPASGPLLISGLFLSCSPPPLPQAGSSQFTHYFIRVLNMVRISPQNPFIEDLHIGESAGMTWHTALLNKEHGTPCSRIFLEVKPAEESVPSVSPFMCFSAIEILVV